jgi:hypothetical protein
LGWGGIPYRVEQANDQMVAGQGSEVLASEVTYGKHHALVAEGAGQVWGDGGAGFLVLSIRETCRHTGSGLNNHLMTVGQQILYGFWGGGHATFLGPRFVNNGYPHSEPFANRLVLPLPRLTASGEAATGV